MNTFGPPKRVFVRGEGCYVWDADGRRYLDLLSGLAVNALGPRPPHGAGRHHRPDRHARDTCPTSSPPRPRSRWPSRLGAMTVGSGSPRSSSPTPAPRPTRPRFKITRMTGRTRIVAAEGAFHGRSLGALAITHNPKYRDPLRAVARRRHLRALRRRGGPGRRGGRHGGGRGAGADPGGERRGRPAGRLPRAGPAALRRCTAPCSGSTRCRPAWAGPAAGWPTSPKGSRADLVTVAKGLGNGFPIGACIANGRAATLLGPGSHGSTFGGNPVAAIAGLAVIAVIERDGLLERATRPRRPPGRGRASASATRRSPAYAVGACSAAIMLTAPIAPGVADAALDAGFIVNAPRPDVLRLAPPLMVTADQLDSFVAVLPGLLDGSPADDLTATSWPTTTSRAAEQTAVLDLADALKADPFKISPLRRSAQRRAAVRQADLRTRISFSVGIAELGGFPMIVDGRLAQIGQREPIARYRPGAGPAVRRHRLADLRPGADRRDGRVRRGAGGQRAHRPATTPARSLADLHDRPRAPGPAGRADAWPTWATGPTTWPTPICWAGRWPALHVRIGAPAAFQPDPDIVARAEPSPARPAAVC